MRRTYVLLDLRCEWTWRWVCIQTGVHRNRALQSKWVKHIGITKFCLRRWSVCTGCLCPSRKLQKVSILLMLIAAAPPSVLRNSASLWRSLNLECLQQDSHLNSLTPYQVCAINPSSAQAGASFQNPVSKLTFRVQLFFKDPRSLTPKGQSPFFGPFLRFRQAIVDAIFVQKISNFWWTCGLVLASRRTNFYKIPNSSLGAMPQKQNYFEVRATRAAKKLFIFKLFWVGFFFINS
jgi:hypothetical protein